MRLLVVEDEPDLRHGLVRALTEEGFAVDHSSDGEDALFRAVEIDYDVVILDLMLPRLSGAAVLEGVRRAGRATPVLVLTARDTVADRVAELNRGADDYMVKPFSIEELVARVRALIRRAARQPQPVVEVGNVRVDVSAQRVYLGVEEIDLTGREFAILELLIQRRGTVVARSALTEHLYDDESDVVSNAIDVHIASLRRKLGPDVIETRRGIGYLIDA